MQDNVRSCVRVVMYVCMVHLTLKTTLKLDVLANCIVQAGLNKFAKILGHCKPILALKSAILITKIVGSPYLCKDPYIQNVSTP